MNKRNYRLASAGMLGAFALMFLGCVLSDEAPDSPADKGMETGGGGSAGGSTASTSGVGSGGGSTSGGGMGGSAGAGGWMGSGGSGGSANNTGGSAGMGGVPSMGGMGGLPNTGGMGGLPNTGGMGGLPNTGGMGGLPNTGGMGGSGGAGGIMQPEICNGLDDDADGQVDEGCACVPPTAETCNGIDDDQDGLIDGKDNNLTNASGNPIWCCETNNGEELTDGIDNDCDYMIDEYLNCTPQGPFEIENGLDDNCNGLVDEGTPNCLYAVEKCNGIDDDCDLVVDDGLNCACSTYAQDSEDCDGNPMTTLWDTPALFDPRIAFSPYGKTKFALQATLGWSDYPGVRYNSLPMPVGSGKWYWEAPVAWNYTGPCIGVGTANTPLTADSTLSNLSEGLCLQIHSDGNGGYAGYLFPGDIQVVSWQNADFKGAVVSVLIDMDCSKLTFWVNGQAATGNPNLTLPLSLAPNQNYYPMAWMNENTYSIYGNTSPLYDLTLLNFGPVFWNSKPAGYKQHHN